MPRAIWNGSISFGMVSIPIKLFSAVSEKSVRFNQLDRRNNARVRQRRVNEQTGEEVPFAEIVKGYELDSGSWVIIDDDDLVGLMPEQNRQVDLEEFVDLEEVDPIYYSGSYWAAPSDAPKPYALLSTALETSKKVGLGRFVMRSKQHLVVVRSVEGRLLVTMMVWADEVVAPEEIPGMDRAVDVELSEKELTVATSLIASLTEEFEPQKYRDTHRDALMDIIETKAAGGELPGPVDSGADDGEVVDLMAALEASVAKAKAARKAKAVEVESEDGGAPAVASA